MDFCLDTLKAEFIGTLRLFIQEVLSIPGFKYSLIFAFDRPFYLT